MQARCEAACADSGNDRTKLHFDRHELKAALTNAFPQIPHDQHHPYFFTILSNTTYHHTEGNRHRQSSLPFPGSSASRLNEIKAAVIFFRCQPQQTKSWGVTVVCSLSWSNTNLSLRTMRTTRHPVIYKLCFCIKSDISKCLVYTRKRKQSCERGQDMRAKENHEEDKEKQAACLSKLVNEEVRFIQAFSMWLC